MRDDQGSRLLSCCLSLLGNTGMYVQILTTNISGYLTIILIILCSFLCMTLRRFFEKSLVLLLIFIRDFYEIKSFHDFKLWKLHIMDYKSKWGFVYSLLIFWDIFICLFFVCYHSIPMSLYIRVISYSSFHTILYLILCVILIKIWSKLTITIFYACCFNYIN